MELAQHHHAYEPLPSLPEGDGAPACPDLVGGENVEWAAISNLDAFFTRVYRYWLEKGWLVILTSRLLNLAALAFTICFSAFLLLGVDWGALHAQCLMAHDRGSCDILAVAVHAHPLRGRSPALVALAALYVALCCLYWLWSAAAAAGELRGVLETRHFVANKLGISERQVRMMTWSEVVHRMVLVQRTTRLCAARDLDEADIVGRIMRKDNYLIGMLNAGVLALHVPAGPLARMGLGVRRRFVLTKTLEWNLYWAVLDPMWDEDGVLVRREWLDDEAALRRRLRLLAALNLAVAPFLLLFLLIYFTMKNAERFYHSPGTLGSRRWSSLAKWRLRELNELPHYVSHRLAASHESATRYLAQFPSPLVTQVARFVSFVAGSFAALLLGLSLLDENLLEVPLAGRNVVWWLALTGILLTASRAFITDAPAALDPERAMAELVAHTHHLPRHWRGRAHTAEVQEAMSGLFQLKVLLFLEELASVAVTPFILGCSLPKCAGAILQFVRDHTVHVEGVGDVCSLAAFDFGRHGNPKYGAPCAAPDKPLRSKQGKMEKSFLTFVATYPTWAPPPQGRQLLAALSQHTESAAMAGAAGLAGLGGFGDAGGGFGGPGASCWSMPQAPASAYAKPAPGAAAPAGEQPPPQQQQQQQHQWQQQQPCGARSEWPKPAANSGGDLGKGLATAQGVHAQGRPPQPSLRPQPGDPLSDAPLLADGEGWDAPAPLGPLGPSSTASDQQQRPQEERGHWQAGAAGSRPGGMPSSMPLAEQQQQQQQQQPAAGTTWGQQPQLRPPLPPQQQPMRWPQPQQHHPQQAPPQQPEQPHWGQQGHPQVAPAHQVLQVWPSTLYPGGPNAAAMLPAALGLGYGAPAGGLAGGMPAGAGAGASGGGDGTWSALGMWGAPSAMAASLAPGPRQLDGSGSGGCGAVHVSDLIPVNETADLGGRLAASHLLLQSFYESRDHTVQHRQVNRAHARSVLLQRALGGGALSVAPFLAASASAAAAAAWHPAQGAAAASSMGNGHQLVPQEPHSPLARTALY